MTSKRKKEKVRTRICQEQKPAQRIKKNGNDFDFFKYNILRKLNKDTSYDTEQNDKASTPAISSGTLIKHLQNLLKLYVV